MIRKLSILLLTVALSLPALSRTDQGSGQQSSNASDTSKDKGKKKSGDSQNAPKNATAKCKDGTYSYAKHHQGACSHHGGVAEWYK